MTKLKLGYWKIRGFGEFIRLMLEYLGIEYENEFYHVGPAPDYNRDCWYDVKHKYGPLANLPYLIDGDRTIFETRAIMNYLSSQHNLDGETVDEKINCDMVASRIDDVLGINPFYSGFTYICYQPEFEQLKPAFLAALPEKLSKLEEFLGDKKFFASDKVTKCDFQAYEMLDRFVIFEPSCLKNFPKLQDYKKRFEEIPSIKAYHESNRYFARPINNTNSQWF